MLSQIKSIVFSDHFSAIRASMGNDFKFFLTTRNGSHTWETWKATPKTWDPKSNTTNTPSDQISLLNVRLC